MVSVSFCVTLYSLSEHCICKDTCNTKRCICIKDDNSVVETSVFRMSKPRMLMKLTYDPNVHNAIWHSDSPFVLEMYSKRQKKCRGCALMFVVDSPKFVICHEEWMGARKIRRRMTQNAFYHCNPSYIIPMHPYFKSREITAAHSTARNLTAEDVKLLSRCGIDLSS